MKKYIRIKAALFITIKYLIFYIIATSCGKKEDSDIVKKVETEKPSGNITQPAALSEILKGYNLVWSDDFGGTTVNTAKWKYRAVGALRKYATVSPSKTISLDGEGNLVIQTTKDADGKYYVGQLATDGIFATKYGYFECRAKMNQYIGTHCAFWLQSNTMGIEDNNPGKNGAEIDIFEYHKKESSKVHHNLHWNGYGTAHMQAGTKVSIDNIGEGFHTFGLLWTNKEYVFYVDGKETWRTNKGLSHSSNQYMILSTELTGFGGDPALGTYPDSVIFDYVKVYQPK